jgi:hypothetical protein
MSPVPFVAAVVLGAAFLPACHHGVTVSNDPTQPVYRKADADFAKYQTVKIHYVSIKTNNNEGVELVRAAFADSIKHEFGLHFKTVEDGDTAAAGELLMDVDLTVNWGSQAARAFVGFGAGKAAIIMKYNVKDGATTLASLDKTDTMSGGFYGGNGKELAFAAADKWTKWFTANVLFPAVATAKK